MLLYVSAIASELSKTITLDIPGSLIDSISEVERHSITNLTLKGNIDARDFAFMRDSLPGLDSVDLSETSIMEYSGDGGTNYFENFYPENEIPSQAFKSSPILHIELPQTFTNIGVSAFFGCSQITSIAIPPSVDSIKSSAFCRTSLVAAVIPEGVEYVGESAFSTQSLEHALIPASVSHIVNPAFATYNVKSIYCKSKVPCTLSDKYEYLTYNSKTKIFVPQGSGSLYKSETPWNHHNILELNGLVLEDTLILAYKNSSTLSTVIYSNTEWTATSDQDWLRITPLSSFAGLDFLTFTYDENNTDDPRNATITITAPNTPAQTITVRQDHRERFLDILPDTVYVNSIGDTTLYLDVESNTFWSTCRDLVSPIDFYPGGASAVVCAEHIGNGQIQITVDSDKEAYPVIETFTINPNDITLQDSFTVVRQPNIIPEVEVSESEVTIPFADRKWGSVSVKVYSDFDIKVKTDALWLDVTTSKSYYDYYTVTFTSTGEELDYDISTTASIIINENTVETIEVTREAGCYFCSNLDTIYLTERKVKGDSLVNIRAMNYNFSEYADWLKSKTWCLSHDLDCFTDIFAELNNSDTARVTTITLFSGYSYKKAVLIQPPTTERIFYTTHPNRELPGESREWRSTIYSNVEWTAVSNDPWITITRGHSASNSDKIIFTVSGNYSSFKRTGKIIVSSDGLEDIIISITQEVETEPYPVAISTEELTFERLAGDSQTVDITSEHAWIASTEQSWLSVDTTEKSITVSVEDNTSGENRHGSISITDIYGNSKTIAVTQTAASNSADGYFSSIFGHDTIYLSALEGSFNNAIISESGWEALPADDWVTVTPSAGDGSPDLDWINYDVYAENYSDEEPRFSTLTFYTNGVARKTFTIKQDGSTIDISSLSETLGSADGSSVSISVQSNITWEATVDVSWLSIEKTENSIKITASENSDLKDRTATITITAGDLTPKEINITQMAAGLSADDHFGSIFGDDTMVVSPINGVFNNAIISTLPWEASTGADWLKVTPSSGQGKADYGWINYDVIAEDYFGDEPRYSTVTFFMNGSERRTFTLEQRNNTITTSSDAVTIAATEAESVEIDVAADSVWEAVNSSEWLSMELKSGSVSFTALENTQNTKRTDTIAFWSEGYYMKRMIVTQLGQTIENSADQTKPQIHIFPNPASKEVSVYGVAGNGFMQIYDCKGILVLETKLQANKQVDIQSLPTGFYTLHFNNDAGKSTQTLIVIE